MNNKKYSLEDVKKVANTEKKIGNYFCQKRTVFIGYIDGLKKKTIYR